MCTKLKKIILLVSVLSAGVVIGWVAALKFGVSFGEYGTLVQEIAHVKVHYWTLNDIKAGEIDSAVSRLELLSKSSINYLENCDSVHCTQTEFKSIQEAIELAKAYESKK